MHRLFVPEPLKRQRYCRQPMASPNRDNPRDGAADRSIPAAFLLQKSTNLPGALERKVNN